MEKITLHNEITQSMQHNVKSTEGILQCIVTEKRFID